MREILTGLLTEPGVEWLALSSVAAGSDILFARSALALEMGWEAVLPLPPAEFRRDFAEADWHEVEQLLDKAEHIRVISKRGLREDAYLDGGMETVDHCDVLLAVWDGAPSRGRGGTAEIVAYARELNRPLILLDATTLAIRRENFDRLKVGDRHLARLNARPSVNRPVACAGPCGCSTTSTGRDSSRCAAPWTYCSAVPRDCGRRHSMSSSNSISSSGSTGSWRISDARNRRAVPLLGLLRARFIISSVLAIVSTAIYAGHSTLAESVAPTWVENWIFGFGPIVLPVLAAGFISMISINDLHRRVARYREMHVRPTAGAQGGGVCANVGRA